MGRRDIRLPEAKPQKAPRQMYAMLGAGTMLA